jgi:mannose-6-phosphate isomerase-like protein (cupin superfamily)
MTSPPEPLHLDDVFAGVHESWSPRVVAAVNGYDVKVARAAGEFREHAHDDTDEFFLVLEGTLHLDLPDRTVTLRAGGTFTVPRGVRHRPRAEPGTRILMFEPRGTVNTGDAEGVEGTAGVRLVP